MQVDTQFDPARSLGELCIQRGLITQADLDECLKAQRQAQAASGAAPRLGELLVQRGFLTAEQVRQLLADQKMEIRYCPRCRIRINVAVRADAAWYRCGRCQGPLVLPPESETVTAVDDSIIIVSREPLPPEVERLMVLPDHRFGKYVLVRELGRGGVGVVYQAWDTYLSQYVALKRIKPTCSADPNMRETRVMSLFKEGRNMIRLRHPGIVSIFDVGRVNREFYISMEYVEGETLAEKIVAARSRGLRSPYFENARRTLRLLRDVARAVHYAHTRPSPIVHCDLKPANVLIDREGHSYVLDFGLARNLKIGSRDDSQISGTPSYMAPEQASGQTEDIDARTDVYALGAMLYEMLTGQPPFRGTLHDVLARAIAEPPVPPSQVLTAHATASDSSQRLLQIPPELEDLCMRCLEKDRGFRVQTMDEVAKSLEAILSPRPPPSAANPPPFPQGSALPQKPPSPSPPPAGAETRMRIRPEGPTAAPPPPPAQPPSRHRRSLRPVIWSAAGLCLLAIPAVYLVLRHSRERERAALRTDIAARIVEFRPDLALASAYALLAACRGGPEEGPAAMWVEEATWMLELRDRLVRRLSARTVGLPELRLHQRTLRSVQILRSDAGGIEILAAGEKKLVPWQDVEPSQIIDLVHDLLGEAEPSDRLSLGIYCLRAGRTAEALEHFRFLKGSPLAAPAERYLSTLMKP